MMTRRLFLRSGLAASLGALLPVPRTWEGGAGSGLPQHPLVTAWLIQIGTHGGAAPAAGTIAAMNVFCYALDAASLTSLILTANCLVPDNLIAACVPIVPYGAELSWYNYSFVAGDLNGNGLKGDGIGKALGTGVIPYTTGLTLTNAGLSAYIASTNTVTGPALGVADTTYQSPWAVMDLYANPGSNQSVRIFGTESAITAAPNPFAGFLSGSRTAGGVALYEANSTTPCFAAATGSTNGSTIPGSTGAEICLLACGLPSGPLYYFSAGRVSFAAVHYGLTLAQTSSLYAAVQALRLALGGGYA